MFTDDLSEVWDSSDFQDSFIKNYFGERKVSKRKASGSLNQKATSKNSHRVEKNVCIDNQNESEQEEDLIQNDESETKHILNNPVKGNVRKKKKLSNDNFQNNSFKNYENNLNVCKEDLNSSIADCSSVKSKRKKRRKNKNKSVGEQALLNLSEGMKKRGNVTESSAEKREIQESSNQSKEGKTLFQNKLTQKLQAAKFRYLNEILYTNTGKEALSYFVENTEEFQDYHVGYQTQVSKWPLNPVDIIINELRHGNKQSVIADLGCGEAKIAETFPKRTVYSFDLVALKDCVTACDMAKVPLEKESVDVVVFCLSLMGTNWKDYLKEGHRLLKLGGELKIAEIESRIENLNDFVKTIEAHGFSLLNKNVSHKMFVFLNFKKVKSKVKTSKIPAITLKPCLYKKR